MTLRLHGCPRCRGTLAIEIYHGAEIANCIACGYEVETQLPGGPPAVPKDIRYPQVDEMSHNKLDIHMRGDTIDYLASIGMGAANIGAIVGTDKRTVYRWLDIAERRGVAR